MTGITIILLASSLIFLSIIIFLIWYILQAVRQIRTAEQYTYDLITGIEELKELMETYVNHVGVVNELEMFYGDETLRELIRHGKALVETFEEYKIDYFPILEMEEELIDDYREQIDSNHEANETSEA